MNEKLDRILYALEPKKASATTDKKPALTKTLIIPKTLNHTAKLVVIKLSCTTQANHTRQNLASSFGSHRTRTDQNTTGKVVKDRLL